MEYKNVPCWRWTGEAFEPASIEAPIDAEVFDLLRGYNFGTFAQVGSAGLTQFVRFYEDEKMLKLPAQYAAVTIMLPEGWSPDGSIVELVLLADWPALLSYAAHLGAPSATWRAVTKDEEFFASAYDE